MTSMIGFVAAVSLKVQFVPSAEVRTNPDAVPPTKLIVVVSMVVVVVAVLSCS